MSDRVTPQFSEPVRATEKMVLAWRQTSFSRRTWFAVTLAAILALHAAILAVLLWHDDPPMAPRAEETPVEVVAQMPEPPAPKPPSPPEQKPPTPQPSPPEKPATSAPRAQNDETVEREAGESESRAPKAEAATVSPPPTPAPSPDKPQPETTKEAKLDSTTPTPPDVAKPDTAKPEDTKPEDAPAEAKLDKAEAAAPPDDPSEAEALDKAPPEPPRRPVELAAAPRKPAPPKPPARPAKFAAAAPQMSPRALPTPIDRLAGASDLPDFVFAKPQRKPTKYKGGSEDNRYLAVVYAMVTQNNEAISLPGGDWQVSVAFQVDGHGDLIGLVLTQSSGYPQVDAAAIDAVRRAAPFPPPPSGGVTGLIARIVSPDARAAQRSADMARER